MWQYRKERPNRSTNNGDMDTIAKRPVSECEGEGRSESMTYMLLERS